MERNDNRSFVDAVYGHIYVPKGYCKDIVDTELFQRLRRIEQTSMRPIFHCAHHDRFSHSLGTFHIGCKIFQYIKENTKKDNELYTKIQEIKFSSIKSEYSDFWDVMQKSYEIACLLHDCGHAPFSHTFEDYYLDKSAGTPPIKVDILNECKQIVNAKSISGSEKKNEIKDFEDDFKSCVAKPHELVSAWLVLHSKGFRDKVTKQGGDPILIARMIMGCNYSDDLNRPFERQIINCFIGLLNGNEIDADRTDYAIRDKWATGLNTTTINLERLYSSIHINKIGNPEKFVVCFKKSALPELESILEIKNYNAFWIFSHHKVLYHERLLKKAVEKLALLFAGKESVEKYLTKKAEDTNDSSLEADSTENDALYKLFDYHNLVEPKEFSFVINEKTYTEELYLLSDDDIIYLLKKFFCTNKKPSEGYLKSFYDRNNYAYE